MSTAPRFGDIMSTAERAQSHACIGEDCELCDEVEPVFQRVDCDNTRCLNSIHVALRAGDDTFNREGWTTSDDCGNHRVWCPEHSGART